MSLRDQHRRCSPSSRCCTVRRMSTAVLLAGLIDDAAVFLPATPPLTPPYAGIDGIAPRRMRRCSDAFCARRHAWVSYRND